MGCGEVGSEDHDCHNAMLCCNVWLLVLEDVFCPLALLLVEGVEQARDTPLLDD